MQIIQTANNKRLHSSSPFSPRRANPYFPLHNKKLLLKNDKELPMDINWVNAHPTEIRKIKTTYARKEKSFENKVEDPIKLTMNRFGKKIESFHSLSPKEKVDFPGPGAYFPCYVQTKNKALAFTFSSSEKFKTIMKSDTPDKIGPGSYNLCINRKMDEKLSPSFLNKKRILFEDTMRKKDPEQPGPGEYYPERFFGAFKKTKNSKFQMFNSSSERFQTETKTNVGPGTYMITKKTTELKNDMQVREYSPTLLDPVKLFKDQNFEEQFPIKKIKTKRIHQKKKSGTATEAISKKNNKFQNLNFDLKGKKNVKLPEDD